MKIYVVTRNEGDGYHLWGVTLLAAYFDAGLAQQHADKLGGMEKGVDVEEVELAPQVVPEE